jgi:hypothetical protein
MINGTKIQIGTVEYTVPPLTLGQLRGNGISLIRQHDELLGSGKGFESYEIRGKVIFLALSRNYPELTEEELFDQLDMKNINKIWLAVLGSSGLTPGEEKAVDGMETGTSAQSTAN